MRNCGLRIFEYVRMTFTVFNKLHHAIQISKSIHTYICTYVYNNTIKIYCTSTVCDILTYFGVPVLVLVHKNIF